MVQVIKRDGSVAKFCLDKISGALVKAFEATQMQFDQDIIDLLALRVTADIQGKMKDGSVHVEDIQDSAEKVLEQAGYTDTAKAFILYRKQRERMRNMKSTILDYKEVVDSYVKVEDWRVKENSTVTYSVGGLILSNSGQSPQTTGSLKSTMRRLPARTEMRISTFMTSRCSRGTVQAGR